MYWTSLFHETLLNNMRTQGEIMGKVKTLTPYVKIKDPKLWF
jgi:hypothetical protein